MDGWVKIFRRIKEKSWYRKSEYVHVWIHLLLSANHKDKKNLVNGQEVILKRGQLLTSRKALEEATGVNENKIYRILKLFENEKQIEQQKTNKFTIITILNYDMYQKNEQENEQQMNSKRTANEQQMNTNKNDKNNMCVIYTHARTCGYCHLGSNFKEEFCFKCMKKNKCELPESPNFKLNHPEGFIEWNDRMLEMYEAWCYQRTLEHKSTDINLFDYDWLNEGE